MSQIFLRIRSFVIVILIPALLSGCLGYQYVASPRYVPLNEKKGDGNFNFYLSSIQLGYAFSNNFSAFATGFQRIPTEFRKTKLFDDTRRRSGESREVNLGLSYFVNRDNFQGEILLGGGLGDMEFYSSKESHSDGYALTMQARKENFFVQPNFTYKFKPRLRKHLSIAAFTKFNSIHYYDISVTNDQDVPLSELPIQSSNSLDDGLTYFGNRSEADLFFIEPGIFVKGGAENIKGIVQVSYVINAGGPSMYYQPYSINIGCSISFDLLNLKK